jgi:uncharacterized protein (DUF1697 family)
VTRWVALLRGVNVGGHRRVPMADLRAGLSDVGLTDAKTYLQSGNAVFSGGPDRSDDVAALVRSVVADRCGVDTDVVVRTGAEVTDVVARNPWPERVGSPTLLNVLLLSAAPSQVRTLRLGPEDEVVADGREVWVWYGAGAGRSRLQVDTAGVVATARNWRTVTALAELSAGSVRQQGRMVEDKICHRCAAV